MKVRAAVAYEAGKPLEIENVDLEGPKAGEVLVEIKATGVCHTDEFTRSGADPEGLFPAILGHEGAGIVVDVGAGVTSLRKGDHVIPLYTPECRQCKACLSRKTNLCTAIRATQGVGLMPDGTTRFSIGGRTRPFQLVTGRVWKGTAFGGARGRTDVPKIVDWYMDGKIDIDDLVTHVMPLADINRAFELMHAGESIRSVVTY
ncbi:MAG TPA: alcohol dehydrogenase catalytic domain-containing protein [Casimicrobiaceae bacterium]